MAPQQENAASRRRTYSILRTLVEEYIGTASPVPSESIARLSPVKVSSATVRNKMAELEEEGYIHRPHISSGGIPSSKGYRFYTDSLEEGLEPSYETKRWIVSKFERGERETESWIRIASSVLSELSRNVSIVTYPKTPSPRVRYVHLVLIEEFLALLILVLEEARLKKHLIPLEMPGDQDNLTTVANKLTDVYTGLTYREMMAKTVELSPFESAVTQGALSVLKEDAERTAAEYILNGLRRMLGQPEFGDQGEGAGSIGGAGRARPCQSGARRGTQPWRGDSRHRGRERQREPQAIQHSAVSVRCAGREIRSRCCSRAASYGICQRDWRVALCLQLHGRPHRPAR